MAINDCNKQQSDCNSFAKAQEYNLCEVKKPSDYALVAKRLEPTGKLWDCLSPLKMALHTAFGSLLSGFESAMCKLQKESLACGSIELINEFEAEYGLPSGCAKSYPTDLAGRQAQVCTARKSIGISTISQLEDLLQTATACTNLKITESTIHSTVGGWTGGAGNPLMVSGGVCVTGITEPLIPTNLPYCPIIYHSTVGGWTGGVGQSLTIQDETKINIIECLMSKHLPASINYSLCNGYNLPEQPQPKVYQPIFYNHGDVTDINNIKLFSKVRLIAFNDPLPADFDYLTDINDNIITIYKLTQSIDLSYYPFNFNIPIEINNTIVGYAQE
jgi:hypothetical protein